MTNKKTTKRALLASVLALFLCFSMLLGTTFAWFTDSVTSANNIIKSGNLDIELEYWNGTAWADVNGASDILTNELWEPGVTEVAYLRVANAGSLVLKYQLGINILNEIAGKNQAGETFKLSDYIQFGVVEGVNGQSGAYSKDDAGRAAAIAAVTDAKKISAGYTKSSTMNPDDELYLALVVYMPTTVDNVANHNGKDVPQIDLGINVLATQMTAESDSFGDQYDKDAWHPDFTVTSVEDLATALASGGKIQVNGTLNAGATQDVPNWTNAPAEFIFDATTLDALKGGKYVLEQGSRYGVVGLISAGESLALSDMEITANSQWPVYLSNYGGTLTLEDIDVTATQGAGIYPYGTNGTTTIKSATVNQKALSDEFAAITPWAGTAIATSNGHRLIIEDGTYIGSNQGVYIYNSGAVVTINGGTFKAPQVLKADGSYSDQTIRGEFVVNGGNFDGQINMTNGYAYCTINGGNFTNFSVSSYSPVVIKGGTFDADPSAYVAPGYQVTNNGDGTYTVGGYKISTGTELVDAIANGKAVELTQDVQIGKINLTDAITNDVVINANGHKITTTDAYGIEVTAGKNVTISNANVEMTKAGDYITYAAGFKIANGDYAGATITLENCTITMANTDWAYAVNIPASVKNLNLVINNCTLEGAVAVQCWGDNNTITITNSKLICNYTTSALYTSYCVALQGDGTNNSENNTLVIDNCEFLYSGVDNFNSSIYSVDDLGTGNTVTVTNCTYGEKVVAE
ncbi:MAG: SipW-dependent-type signal peptide-containing protein [Clostridia bacterium]|nr:SipW-dependent-type signal peptide-containing protein [Clostridia bacterium]